MNACLEIDRVNREPRARASGLPMRSYRRAPWAGRGSGRRAMKMCTPLCPRPQREIAGQQAPRLAVSGPAAVIIVKEPQSLRTRQKTPDGAIEMDQVEQSAPHGDRARAAKVLEIDEVDFPLGAIAAGYHQIGLLKVEGVNPGVVEAADFAGDRAQHRTSIAKSAPSARQYDLAHDARVVERLTDHVARPYRTERARFGRD